MSNPNSISNRCFLGVELPPTLIPAEDEDMGKALARSFTRRGIKVHASPHSSYPEVVRISSAVNRSSA
jgi:sugar phosphate isomerase/epimerase